VPAQQEYEEILHAILRVLPVEQVWVNPDCGLKTRNWEEVRPALTNMVAAAQTVRAGLGES
jgi:5-methyltetrahydropteroyltriglutamate--homocysteine methyltransferase